MRVRGAILTEAPGRYTVVELDLDEPLQGEVLVRLVAAGLCHSDDHAATGDLPVRLPMCGGHEGAGVIEAAGPGTDRLAAGDHVVFSYIPVCGRCRWCSEGRQNLCDLGSVLGRGSRVDVPTYRMHYDGIDVGQMSCVSTFSEYTTVDVRSVVPIPKDIPLEIACLVGCSVVTGWGAAVNSAEVTPGDVVICMGIGGIGINSVQGAAHAGASEVVAVDPIALKRDAACRLGATRAFATMEEATDYVRGVTSGQGADATIVTVGVTTGQHIAEALTSVRKAGTVVVSGLGGRSDVGIPISGTELVLCQKRIQGSLFGQANPFFDIPHLLDLYMNGHLKLDELITSRYGLDDVAIGYDDMHAGRNIRGLVTF